jgi:hypothetical protein
MTDDKAPKTITVLVNNNPVAFNDHKVTGLKIKETAMNQGVPIQLDFILYEVHGNSLKMIENDEIVTLHPHQEFRAVTPDDNS